MLSHGEPGAFIHLTISKSGISERAARIGLRDAGWRPAGQELRRGSRILTRLFGGHLVPYQRWPLVARVAAVPEGVEVEVMDDFGRMWQAVTPDGSEGTWSAEKRMISGVEVTRDATPKIRQDVLDALSTPSLGGR